jgi:hypothetical protein
LGPLDLCKWDDTWMQILTSFFTTPFKKKISYNLRVPRHLPYQSPTHCDIQFISELEKTSTVSSLHREPASRHQIPPLDHQGPRHMYKTHECACMVRLCLYVWWFSSTALGLHTPAHVHVHFQLSMSVFVLFDSPSPRRL